MAAETTSIAGAQAAVYTLRPMAVKYDLRSHRTIPRSDRRCDVLGADPADRKLAIKGKILDHQPTLRTATAGEPAIEVAPAAACAAGARSRVGTPEGSRLIEFGIKLGVQEVPANKLREA